MGISRTWNGKEGERDVGGIIRTGVKGRRTEDIGVKGRVEEMIEDIPRLYEQYNKQLLGDEGQCI